MLGQSKVLEAGQDSSLRKARVPKALPLVGAGVMKVGSRKGLRPHPLT